MATYSFHRLIMGKVEISTVSVIEFYFFTEMFIEFSTFHTTYVGIALFDWLLGQHKLLIFEKVCFSVKNHY